MNKNMLAAAAVVIATSQAAFGVTVPAHASVSPAHASVVSHPAETAPAHVVASHESTSEVRTSPVKPINVYIPIGHVSAAKPVSGASAVKGK